jgi:nucleotide-binding universal stress UspA family protein
MFKTILIAVDLDEPESAARLAQAARMMAAQTGASLHVVNVVPEAGMSLVGAALGPGHFAGIMEAARQAASDWIGEALPEGARLHVVQGTIYDAILKEADRIDADAIVVGAHRPQLRDYLVGPNAARVVRHARQSVFVIR